MDRQQATSLVVGDLAQSASNAVSALYAGVEVGDGDQGLDMREINTQLERHSEALESGDMRAVEDMLAYQSHVLNQIFNLQVVKAAQCNHIEQFETFMRIALKAQNQTRQTLSTLAEVKGVKRTTFIKQQNQAINQQINNSEKIEHSTPELEGAILHEQLDTGTQGSILESNTPLEAVGALYRAENS